MANRRIDSRRIKIHFAYSVEEAASALQTHKNTVRGWIKKGLPIADHRRPIILSGASIRAFLDERRAARKRPLKPGELYCFKCRSPKMPAADMADFIEVGNGLGALCALCPDCETVMHRRTSLTKLKSASGRIDVKILPRPTAPKRDN